ncbi:hypothetical protein PoB_004166200 [Plakobranchus ocellatus]|uniref:Secreted protein n=1 Tax=Plakobranchus ocellatus TaxID=259542 RepID=A0AAV4B6N1_9GAST|nr:hypothetical protein PoB_004166200 [Plakobranchus ocellatus]
MSLYMVVKERRRHFCVCMILLNRLMHVCAANLSEPPHICVSVASLSHVVTWLTTGHANKDTGNLVALKTGARNITDILYFTWRVVFTFFLRLIREAKLQPIRP